MNLKRLTAALVLSLLTLQGCSTSPLGRSQLLMQNEASLAASAEQEYLKMKKEVPISKDKALTAYINCVVAPLTKEVVGDNWEVTLFESDQVAYINCVVAPLTKEVVGDNWEVTLFESDQVNAFALPGGKIGVYTGILKFANNQDRLAAVVAHEIAHVLSHHANERVSAATLANIGMVALAIAGSRNQNTQLAVAALGLGVQYGVIMPYSRAHEVEADLLGLDIMAKAGFDPREAAKLWEAMKGERKQSIPEWMSTHPSDDTRINSLRDREDEALYQMKAAHAAGKKPRCVMPK
ncbi:MAG: hypothetical protein B7Y29_07615 [Thiotrichales bacterium 16-46-22]|nr:MAG: hypothetical protein B7Y29_07615 [Thiotrichales bacterium 16-46-22]